MTHTLEYFNLYHRMIEECNNKLETINLITNDLNNLGFSNASGAFEDVDYFIGNFTKIEYNDTNIHKYCELVFRFGLYAIDSKFINHIINNYVFQKNVFLDYLINYEQFVDNILNKLTKEYNNCKDDDILYIIKYIDPQEIKQLNVPNNENISDVSIRYLTNLTSLNASFNDNIRWLQSNVPFKSRITDESVKHLTNLTSLNASFNSKITDDGIKHLINLISLEASDNENISDISVKYLIHLTSLNAMCNYQITDASIKCLTNLISLDASSNNSISDERWRVFLSILNLQKKICHIFFFR